MPFGNGRGHRRNNGHARGRIESRKHAFGKNLCGETVHGSLQRDMLDNQTCIPAASAPGAEKSVSNYQELENLKQQTKTLLDRMDSILSRINTLSHKETPKSKSKNKACVIESKCAGCGICLNSCSRGAITLKNTARIIIEKCTGCGVCVNACPNEALFLKKYEN
jgi:ferredoxin